MLKNSRVPPCLLVKRLSLKAGLGHKSRVHVIYFEDASTTCGNRPCGTCLASKSRSAEQKQFLQEFTDRSFASIRFQETKTIEDTTSRYVDGVPKAQPAPAVIGAPGLRARQGRYAGKEARDVEAALRKESDITGRVRKEKGGDPQRALIFRLRRMHYGQPLQER